MNEENRGWLASHSLFSFKVVLLCHSLLVAKYRVFSYRHASLTKGLLPRIIRSFALSLIASLFCLSHTHIRTHLHSSVLGQASLASDQSRRKARSVFRRTGYLSWLVWRVLFGAGLIAHAQQRCFGKNSAGGLRTRAGATAASGSSGLLSVCQASDAFARYALSRWLCDVRGQVQCKCKSAHLWQVAR